jgi:hypothetical protein
MKTSKLKKRMSSGSSLTSKLYDKIIKMLSKSHETIPLSVSDPFLKLFKMRCVIKITFLNWKI